MHLLLYIAFLLLAPAPLLAPDEPTLQDQILEAANKSLATRYPDAAARLNVRLLRTGGQLNADQPIQLHFPASTALPRAHVQVKIHQQTTRGWQEQGWAMLYVAHFDSVAVAARTLKKEGIVTADDLRFLWMETTRYRGDPMTPATWQTLAARGDLFANRHLAKDRALRADDLRTALDVALGSAVIMTYKRDQFILEFSCKARKAGFIGDEIKLFTPATNKTYRARITGPGKAVWLETLK